MPRDGGGGGLSLFRLIGDARRGPLGRLANRPIQSNEASAEGTRTGKRENEKTRKRENEARVRNLRQFANLFSPPPPPPRVAVALLSDQWKRRRALESERRSGAILRKLDLTAPQECPRAGGIVSRKCRISANAATAAAELPRPLAR
ncbi:Hypothetical predicted protein [Olea europaea subsp. europaea]|uniref:Uncharacterized protein n=1 Tax=Olea europaea subsp. europaea TaxID=158383 RepID=A0A8S0RCQ2_OLEEU|nr:Hypothetical predicted protein [Olea europaea subsp. europaea]